MPYALHFCLCMRETTGRLPVTSVSPKVKRVAEPNSRDAVAKEMPGHTKFKIT